VKKAYRALSKLYHPDKNFNLEEAIQRLRESQMVLLNVAYQVLMSPRQRRQHDLSRNPEPSTSSSGVQWPRGVPSGSSNRCKHGPRQHLQRRLLRRQSLAISTERSTLRGAARLGGWT
ncbi:unnamed protein product, partial [Polarella glacialis]